ncbi:MAG: NifU family protein [Microthrixaceae bacterium]
MSDTPTSPFANDGQASPEDSGDGAGATQGAEASDSAGPSASGTDVSVDMTKVEEVIEIMRPAIQADGGDIELHGVDDAGVVTVELQGACVSCPASTVTMKAGIERIMKDRVPGVTAVVQPDDEEFDLGTAVSL